MKKLCLTLQILYATLQTSTPMYAIEPLNTSRVLKLHRHIAINLCYRMECYITFGWDILLETLTGLNIQANELNCY